MWIVWALSAALFTSLNDVFAKKVVSKVGAPVLVWGLNFFAVPFLYAAVSADKMPVVGPLFWQVLIVQGIILSIASIFYFKAIESSDLSITVPMLTFTPLFLLVTSPLMLGEFPRPMGLWGIILIVSGSYLLNINQRHNGYLGPLKALVREKGPRYMLAVAILFSVGANMDKIGVRHSSPLMWSAAISAAATVLLSVFLCFRKQDIWTAVRANWGYLVLLGIINAVIQVCNMIAIQLTLVPYLIAIKRLSVMITLVLGFVIFKEKGYKERSAGTVLMVLGAALISIAQ